MAERKYKRIFTIVIDSLGVGALADAAAYGDEGTDTLGHISREMEEFKIPNLQKLGMANLHPLKQVPAVEQPLGYFMKMNEASTGNLFRRLRKQASRKNCWRNCPDGPAV